LKVIGDHIDINTTGKTLVLPTEDAVKLPLFNEYTLSNTRLTIAESPFGGLKGVIPPDTVPSPDYCPGTLYTPTDGIYLTDTSGTNSTKTLTAGKLKELSLLSVDTVNHTITEEFIVANTSDSNNPTVIDACDSATGWSASGFTITSTDGILSASGNTSVSGSAVIQKSFSLDLSPQHIISFKIRSSVSCKAVLYIYSGAYYRAWYDRIQLTADTWATINIPIRAPTGSSELYPSAVSWASGDYANITQIKVGISGGGDSVPVVISIDNITADTAKSAYVELQTPNNLAPSSLRVEVYDQNVSQYYHAWTASLDPTYTLVASDSSRFKTLDDTSFNDIYGSWGGRGLFLKGTSGATVNGYYSSSHSAGTMTYSANAGTSKRIGLRVDLPPSDGGRTNFNKIRLKTVLRYTDTVGNVVPDLSGNNNTGTIVGGVTKLNDGGLRFYGTESYVSIPDNAALRMTGGGTINAWIYPISLGGNNVGRVIDKSAGTLGNNGYYLATGGTNAFLLRVNSGTITYSSNNAINLSQWQYISVDFNSSGRKIYVNLIDVTGSGSGETGLPPDIAGSVRVGNRSSATDYGFDGNIKDITFYNRILTPSEKEAAKNGNPPSSGLIYRGLNSIPINMGSTTHQFADSTNTSYGLQNLSKPWIALYDPTSNLIDFYLFTYRPKNLEFKRDESGTIYEVKLYPGNGLIYYGQIHYSDLSNDSDSNDIPDCLEAAVDGSVTKFLANYSMVI